MKINWRIPILAAAAIFISAAVAASQGVALGGNPWWYADVFWPNFLVFLIPSFLALGLVEVCNRFLLPGPVGDFPRKCAWWALGMRVAFLIIVPLAMQLWGYPSDKNRIGLVETDALNATSKAWDAAQSNQPVLETWTQGSGDNTGGITVMGVILFRLFSSDQERALLLGLLAAAVSALTVIPTFRLANELFSERTARVAAVIVAVYPEAVMLGALDVQQGYLALVLGVELLALAGLILWKKTEPGKLGAPRPVIAAVAFVLSLVAMFLLSYEFFILSIFCGALFAVWLADPRRRVGRILWIAGGLGVLVLIVMHILSLRDVIPSDSDYLYSQYHYLYGLAWSEYDKIAATGGGDLFQSVLATMDRTVAFLLAALYGLLQPVLPAAIGHRNQTAVGGSFWQALGIYRSLGWYLALPLLFYGTLKSVRGLFSRKPELMLAVIFWAIAFIGSYRAFGDQWDNPRYRFFAFVPMALLAAWAWVQWREKRDAWFLRIAIPFAVAVIGLTVWYLLRDYAGVQFPVVASLGVLVALAVLAFVATLFLFRPKKSISAG
ncbi:MAG: glycosyltransferase family 39 protein [Anaerolineales bacterium]|jgi:hypothetical protein